MFKKKTRLNFETQEWSEFFFFFIFIFFHTGVAIKNREQLFHDCLHLRKKIAGHSMDIISNLGPAVFWS